MRFQVCACACEIVALYGNLALQVSIVLLYCENTAETLHDNVT